QSVRIDGRRQDLAAQASVPGSGCIAGLEIPGLEHHITPSVKDGHGGDPADLVAGADQQFIVEAVAVGGKHIGDVDLPVGLDQDGQGVRIGASVCGGHGDGIAGGDDRRYDPGQALGTFEGVAARPEDGRQGVCGDIDDGLQGGGVAAGYGDIVAEFDLDLEGYMDPDQSADGTVIGIES